MTTRKYFYKKNISVDIVDFQNFKRLIKRPFIIYGNFECVLIPSTNNIDFDPNTKK